MKKERNQGITLIALVVTIVVLILLAVVSMNSILGNEGLFSRANQSKITQENAEVEDRIKLIYLKYIADKNDPEIGAATSLMEFLVGKNIVDASSGKLDITKLLERNETDTGKGQVEGDTKKDVYIMEKVGEKYIIKYYNKAGEERVVTEFTEI